MQCLIVTVRVCTTETWRCKFTFSLRLIFTCFKNFPKVVLISHLCFPYDAFTAWKPSPWCLWKFESFWFWIECIAGASKNDLILFASNKVHKLLLCICFSLLFPSLLSSTLLFCLYPWVGGRSSSHNMWNPKLCRAWGKSFINFTAAFKYSTQTSWLDGYHITWIFIQKQ